jgi:phytoene dehydrogenase-like protein
VHVQYAPHTLHEASWDTALCDRLARNVVARLSQYAPRLSAAVVKQELLSPLDFEQMHGCPEGQLYHAALGLDQTLWMRPTPDLAHYRTPIRGLYLCGPGMHPGGGILGAAGANAARVIVSDLKRRPSD